MNHGLITILCSPIQPLTDKNEACLVTELSKSLVMPAVSAEAHRGCHANNGILQ